MQILHASINSHGTGLRYIGFLHAGYISTAISTEHEDYTVKTSSETQVDKKVIGGPWTDSIMNEPQPDEYDDEPDYYDDEDDDDEDDEEYEDDYEEYDDVDYLGYFD